MRGSLVDQVVPAECYVAELSTSETDPTSESSVADARDSSAVERAHEEADSKTEKHVKRTLVTVKRTLAIGGRQWTGGDS